MPAEDQPREAPVTLPPRVELLTAFLDQFFVRRRDPDPAARTDAHDLCRAFRAWAQGHGEDTAGPAVVYSDLRRLGLAVRRSSANRYAVMGLVPAPHHEAALERLLGLADDPDRRRPQEARTMARDLTAQARDLAADAMARLMPATFEAVFEALASPDLNTRLRATELVWARTLPKLAVKPVEEDAIDVKPVENRPSLSDVMAVIEAQARGREREQGREQGQGREQEQGHADSPACGPDSSDINVNEDD